MLGGRLGNSMWWWYALCWMSLHGPQCVLPTLLLYLCSFIASNLVPPFQCFLNGFVCVCSMLSRRISVLFTVETPGHASNDNPGHYAASDLCGHLSWIFEYLIKKCRCFVKSSNPRFVFWSASSKLLFFPICRIHAEHACVFMALNKFNLSHPSSGVAGSSWKSQLECPALVSFNFLEFF